MKNKLLILFFIGLVINICSCQPNDQPEGVTTEDIALADAAGAMEGYFVSLESGFGLVSPQYAAAFALISGAAASAFTAQGNRTIPINYNLPSEYILEANPFECIGISHNKSMPDLQNSPTELVALSELDSTACTRVINLFDQCAVEFDKAGFINLTKTTAIRNKIDSLNIPQYKNKNIHTILNEKAISSSPGITPYIQGFFMQYQNAAQNGVISLNAKMSYINNEIQAVLNNSDSQNIKNTKLVFLTVFKHSIFYWSN